MKNITFSVTQEVKDLGVKILTARITGVRNNKSDSQIDEFLATELDKVKELWKTKDYKEDKILQGFRELHTKVGRSNRDYPASPEVLIRLLTERGRFPRINSVVDIYNLISVQTQLALGAHDIEKVTGNISLRLTDGTETFVPLGSNSIEKVPVGEYAYIDDGNNIICRLEVLQVEPTKITESSNDIFFIIQGNLNTDNEYIEKSAEELTETVVKFCGGNYSFLNTI